MSVVVEPADEQSRRMRDGVRARITGVARQAGAGMLRLTPPALVALLCAGAFAPVIAAAGAGAEIAAGIGVLGSVGAEILGDLVTDTIDRLRGDGRAPDPAEAERDLARRIEETLAAGGERAARLQGEIAAVLHEIGAARVALETVIETGDRELQQQMTVAFETLGTEFVEFGFLLTDVRDAAESILETLLRSEAERQADSERLRRQSAQLRMIHDEVALIERRTRSAPPAAAPDGDGTPDRAGGAGGPDSAVQAGRTGVASGVVWSGCPYQGLWPFEPEHAAIFYGRERLTAELTGRLAERLTGLGMVIVTGASGAGKSSLLRAGLLPALARGSLSPAAAGWPQVLLPLTRAPLDELAVQLAALGGTDVAPLRRTLAEHPEHAHLAVRQVLLAHRRTFPAPSPPDAYPSGPPSSGRPGSPSGAPGSSSSGSAAAGRERPSAVPTDGVTPSPGKGVTADRLVLVVDQFEKTFAPDTGEAEREAFVTALRAAAGTPCGPEDTPPALVVIGVRGDFWARCADYPQLTEALQDGQFVVGPMTEPELRRAISGPATAAGLELEPGLVDDILAELRRSGTTGGYEAGALPLLSQAMLLTWENREGTRLTRRGYGLTGGVAHALRISAEAVYQALPPHRQEIAAELFRRMTAITPDGDLARRSVPRADLRSASVAAARDVNATPGLDVTPRADTTAEPGMAREPGAAPGETAVSYGEAAPPGDGTLRADVAPGTDAPPRGAAVPPADAASRADTVPRAGGVPREDLPDVDAVLGAFADRRLVILDEHTAQIAHDALLSAWPRPGEWVEEDRKGLLIRQRLGAAARDWAESGRDDGLLYRGARLAEAREWADGREDLTAEEELFLRASTAAAEAALTEERRRRRRVTRLAAGLAVLLVVALVAGAVAVQQRATSDRQRAEAESRQWAAESTLAADADPRRAMMFAALAWRRDHTPEARGAVLSAQMLNHAGQLGDNGSIAVAISPDGRFVATGGTNGEVGLWDARTHRLVTRLRGLTGRTLRLAFSPDGTMLAAGATRPGGLAVDGPFHQVMAWAVPSGRALRPPPGVPLGSLAWRPDGRALAVGTAEPGRVVVRQWDPRAGRDLGTFTSARAQGTDLRYALPASLAYSADGSRLAIGHVDGTATMFTAAGREIATLRGHGPAGVTVAFSPDGTLATGGVKDGKVFFWDPAGRRIGEATTKEHSSVGGLAYADARRLFVVGGDTRLRVWDVDTRTWDTDGYVRPTGELVSVGISADGSTIVAGGPGGPTALWHRKLSWLSGTDPDAAMTDVAVDRSGDRLAAVDGRGSVYVWDVASSPPKMLFTEHSTAALGLATAAYAPDGSLATTSSAGVVRVFDPHGFRRAELELGDGLIAGQAAFSPDGTFLVVAADTPSSDAGDDRNALYIWRTRALSQPPVVLPLKAEMPGRILFTPDGSRLLATTDDDTLGAPVPARVREWRLPGFAAGRTLWSGQDQVVGIALSHDGRALAVVGRRRLIELWDLRRDRRIREFGGQTSTLRDVAFSPDDRVIATGTQRDALIRLWDPSTGRPLATLTGHTAPLNRLVFAPRGETLVTASVDGTVGVWNTDAAVAVRRICAALFGPTLASDWKALGVDPATAPC